MAITTKELLQLAEQFPATVGAYITNAKLTEEQINNFNMDPWDFIGAVAEANHLEHIDAANFMYQVLNASNRQEYPDAIYEHLETKDDGHTSAVEAKLSLEKSSGFAGDGSYSINDNNLNAHITLYGYINNDGNWASRSLHDRRYDYGHDLYSQAKDIEINLADMKIISNLHYNSETHEYNIDGLTGRSLELAQALNSLPDKNNIDKINAYAEALVDLGRTLTSKPYSQEYLYEEYGVEIPSGSAVYPAFDLVTEKTNEVKSTSAKGK